MSINKENLPLYIVALRNKLLAAKGLCSDARFNKPDIHPYYTIISRGESESLGKSDQYHEKKSD
jgi:hypothetical protein